MQSCFKSSKNFFGTLSQRCDNCCQSCQNCTDCCCKCLWTNFGDVLEGFSTCVGDLCRKQMQFCSCFIFFYGLSPIIYGSVGYAESTTISCSQPIRTHLLSLVLMHFANFCFFFYLLLRFGKQSNQPMKRFTGNFKEKNDGQKIDIEETQESVFNQVINLISYDCGVCLFSIYIAFLFIWCIIGSSWRSVADEQLCRYGLGGEIMLNSHMICLVTMYIFTIITIIVAFTVIFIKAQKQGSCQSWDLIRFIIQCLTLGLCDLAKCCKGGKELNQNAHDRYKKQCSNQSEVRTKWLERAINFFDNMGIGGRPQFFSKEPKDQSQNPTIIDIKDFNQVNHTNKIDDSTDELQENNINSFNQSQFQLFGGKSMKKDNAGNEIMNISTSQNLPQIKSFNDINIEVADPKDKGI